MRSLQNRRSLWRRLIFSWPVAILLFCFAIYMAYVVFGMYRNYHNTSLQMAASAEKLNEVKAQKADLEQKVESLQSEQGVETALRQKFLVAKDGEHVLVLVDPNNPTTTATSTENTKSWWKKFLSIF